MQMQANAPAQTAGPHFAGGRSTLVDCRKLIECCKRAATWTAFGEVEVEQVSPLHTPSIACPPGTLDAALAWTSGRIRLRFASGTRPLGSAAPVAVSGAADRCANPPLDLSPAGLGCCRQARRATTSGCSKESEQRFVQLIAVHSRTSSSPPFLLVQSCPRQTLVAFVVVVVVLLLLRCAGRPDSSNRETPPALYEAHT